MAALYLFFGCEGAAFLNSALVSKMKVLPKTPIQPIEINPVE